MNLSDGMVRKRHNQREGRISGIDNWAQRLRFTGHFKQRFTSPVTAFYERGCQEKQFGDDRTTIDYPAHTVMGRCGFRFYADSW